jgi:hypothetical protein
MVSAFVIWILVLVSLMSSALAASWGAISSKATIGMLSSYSPIFPALFRSLACSNFFRCYSASPARYDTHTELLPRIAESYARSISNGQSSSSMTASGSGSTQVTRRSSRIREGLSHGNGNGNQQLRHGLKNSHGSVAVRNRSDEHEDLVNIMYWNIFHDFTLMLTSPEFQTLLLEYDIMFFAETDMLPGEDESADVPEGYTLVSLPRKPLVEWNSPRWRCRTDYPRHFHFHQI